MRCTEIMRILEIIRLCEQGLSHRTQGDNTRGRFSCVNYILPMFSHIKNQQFYFSAEIGIRAVLIFMIIKLIGIAIP